MIGQARSYIGTRRGGQFPPDGCFAHPPPQKNVPLAIFSTH